MFGTILHTVSLLSSSFVEEEHQTWYFFTLTLHFCVTWKILKSGVQHDGTKIESESYDADCYSSMTNNLKEEIQTNLHQRFTKLKKKPQNIQNFKNDDISHLFQLQRTSLMKDNVNDTDFNKENDTDFNTEGFQGDKNVRYKFPWKCILASLGVLILSRIMRSLNQTGDKWLHIPDVGDWLVRFVTSLGNFSSVMLYQHSNKL